MAELEDQGETLEEKFARLREEGVPDKQIVRAIFEENYAADIDELMRITGMKKLDIGRIKGAVGRKRKAEQKRKEALGEAEPPGPYKGPVDATLILRQILAKHPDIPPKVVEEVLSWAEYGPIHPTQLVYLLQSMRGIQSTTANIVAQKYSLALQKASQEGKLQIPPPIYSPQLQQPQWGPMPFQTPYQQPQVFPYTGAQPLAPTRPLTQTPYTGQFQQPLWRPPEDIGKVVKEEIREMKGYVDTKLEAMRPTEQFIEVQEPLQDAEGSVLLGPDRKPFVRTRRIPVSMAGQAGMMGGDPELRMLEKMKHYKELFGEKGLTAEKVRSIIKEEQPKKGEEEAKPVTRKEVEEATVEAATKAVETIMEEHKKEDVDERRHKELLDAVRTSASGKIVEGYKEDSFRMMGQGLTETASILKERKPIEVIIREGGPLILGKTPPKEVEAEATGGIIERLKRRGWVTEA